MAVLQRLEQGVRALLAQTQEVDEKLAAQYLNRAQMELFHDMARVDQLHVLNVLRSILAHDRAHGRTTPHDLAVAALLHDAGKGRYHMTVLEKSMAVIMRKLTPALYDELGRTQRLDTWHAALTVYRYHAQWSADMLAETGASERAIWLAAHHQDNADDWRDHPHHDLLCRLQRADDIN